ncbi:two-component system sporulation sensor kinase A [Cytobacillus eiseniae]|uniref:histidine kinase n=1 Tax=Cytobacillus eiseniae TaxID=762947 RepID=A0ABS4RGM3_9BACI|nr:PAS domain S-box protein [Cytobacillus eiseniae]MBP2242045.1 two-component system sporulation sensor kinase A [Cytobacillus eiseniae]
MLEKIKLDHPQLFIQAFENSAIGMALITSNGGDLLKVNQALCQILSYEKSELLTLNIKDIIHPEDSALDLHIIQTLQSGEQHSFLTERRYIHKNGHTIWALMSVSLVRDQQGNPLYYISQIQDITNRKLAEEKLREGEERYHRIVEESPDGVIIMKEERCLFINQTGLELLGLKQKRDIVGRPIYDFVHPDDHERLKQRNMQNELIGPIEKRFIRMDGKVIDVELKTIPTIYQDQQAVHAIIRDVSNQKQTKDLIINSEKLKIAGQLAAGIAHEVRNPLTAIKGFFQMMEKDLKENQMYFDVITSEINRIETILNELLVLARPQEVKYDLKNIDTIVNHVITLLKTQTNLNSIEIVKNIEPNLPPIKCNENQLKQVFINFLQNAVESMSTGGRISIYIRNQDSDSICIQIIDQGSGIPAHLLNRIGEPFFTTKEHGTGLGIMICKNIIEEHRGKLSIESSPEGTQIEISLPIV